MMTRGVTIQYLAAALCVSAALPAICVENDPPAAAATIVPRPARVLASPGGFQITEKTPIRIDAGDTESRAVAEVLAAQLRAIAGFPFAVVEKAAGETSELQIALSRANPAADGSAEAYTLTISPTSIVISGAPHGLFHGGQSLAQLIASARGPAGSAAGGSPLSLPSLRIEDQPRYAHRGMLLDCGRHFLSVEFIKRYIDLLAYHKLNVLHWHLTEDQGWRIEINKHPKLTGVGAWRTATRDSEQPRDAQGRYGGYYTQAQIRDIVKYAADRFITVIPEIELPGHSVAALAAYPELSCTGGPFQVSTKWGVHDDIFCAGNEQTFALLEDVLSETIALFPSKIIHIGGDEAPKTRWSKCARCQARIKAEGLKDEHELQSYFIKRIEKFLASKGRRLIGWDEILEGGLAPNAIVQSWRGMDGAIAAATAGHDVIASPTTHCYLDYAQGPGIDEPRLMGFCPLERTYQFEPSPEQLTPEQSRHILGVQGNMWTEHAPPALIDRQVFPRLCAIAEVGWSPKQLRDWADFERRMVAHDARLDALGVKYYVPPPQFAALGDSSAGGSFSVSSFAPTSGPITFASGSVTVGFIPPARGGEIRFTRDGSDPGPQSERYTAPVNLGDSAVLVARTFLATGNASPAVVQQVSKLKTHAPVDVKDAKKGVVFEYIEGRFNRIPPFDTIPLHASGVTNELSLLARPRPREDAFALRFRGFFRAPADGIFTFTLNSDDGSRMWIGDERIIENDGLHAPTEKSGRVSLRKGFHPITIEYFELGGSEMLMVGFSGPEISQQVLTDEHLVVSGELVAAAEKRVLKSADDLPETLRPVPRTDDGWIQRHERFNSDSKRDGIKLVFIGDSITQGWEDPGKAAWEKYFAPHGALNLGISGDRTQHVLWRLENGNLAGLTSDRSRHPKVVVVMIGTNNSNGADHTADEIAQGIVGVVKLLREKLPETRVLLLAIFPRSPKPDAQRAKSASASASAAAQLKDDAKVTYLDIGDKFLKPGGELPPEIMPDYLHLSPRGYEVWAEAIDATVKKLMDEK